MTSDRRKLLVTVAIVAFLAVDFVVLWRFLGHDGEQTKLVANTTTTTVTQMPTTIPQQEPYAALAAILPTELDGFQIDTGAKATGPLDFEAAVAAESDRQAERSLLETRKYEAGYGRAFTNGEADVYMVVYEFDSAENAGLYLADGIINLTGKGAGTYDIPEIASAKGFSQGTESDGHPVVVHGVVFSKGNRFVLVFTRSASTNDPGAAKALASALFAGR